MAYLLTAPSRKNSSGIAAVFVAKYSSGAVADSNRFPLTILLYNISLLTKVKAISGKAVKI